MDVSNELASWAHNKVLAFREKHETERGCFLLSLEGQCREVKPGCHGEPFDELRINSAKQSVFAAEIASSLPLLAMTDMR